MAREVQNLMNAWGREFILSQTGIDIGDGTHVYFKDDTIEDGYCDTCWDTSYVVRVYGGGLEAMYYGGFADILREMNGKGY